MGISLCKGAGRRGRGAGGVLAIALLLIACHRETPRYNVLLVTLDTFRADRPAPTLEGVVFANADSPVPLTLPAHSSLLSGVLPPQHGLRNNGGGSFPADRDTLATVLARNGYRTGAFVSSFVLNHRFGLNRGFDVYDDEVQPDPTGAAASEEAERRGGATIDRALAWLRQSDTRPFFAWVHLYDAHAPYAPPEPYPQTYDGEVVYVDAQVARLLAAIDRKNTIVAIVGDHGEALGEHDELTHGLLLYEPTLHVPLIVAAPALQPRVVQQPVSTVDLAPTLAKLAGIQFGTADLLSAPTKDIYAETRYPAQFGWSALASMRRGDVKVIRAPKPEVYDLRSDPKETRNTIDAQRRAYNDALTKLDAIGAGTTATSPVDEETKRKLASLGYVAPGGGGGTSNRDPKDRTTAFKLFEHATWSLNAGLALDAVQILGPLVRDDPQNAPFREKLAQAYKALHQTNEAIALYRQAVALAPQSADAWYNLATALQESGAAREAAIALSEAEKRDPKRPELHNVKGVALIESGDAAGAEREFRAAIDADPRSARAYNNLGNALRAQNRFDDAAGAYRQAIALAPLYPDPRNGLGVILVQQSRAKDALPYFDEALRIAPDFYEATLNRAIALLETGDAAGAKRELTALLARMPRNPSTTRVRTDAEALLARAFR
ncbi:MAG TPA: sulfatase-like hydrolase/transferase [Thermoanaerobaculia bacterium]|nr:sulfatase-like hydrolase/transferase [Thermoanaerobaculia bacterium]